MRHAGADGSNRASGYRAPAGRAGYRRPERHRLRVAPMLAGMGLVVGMLVAGSLASRSPDPTDALDCGTGPVQVLQFDGAPKAVPVAALATPAEARAAAHRAAADFVGELRPGVAVDEVVDAPAEEADATVATRAGGRVTAVVALRRDASGHQWAVDRATLCASDAAPAPAGPQPAQDR